jgi:flagellar protein FliL
LAHGTAPAASRSALGRQRGPARHFPAKCFSFAADDATGHERELDSMAAKAKAADNETEEVETAEGGQQAPKRKLPLKLIAMIAGGLVVAGGLGVGGYMMFGGSHESHAAVPAVKPAVFVDLPEVLVNLSNVGSDRTQYLKVKVVLELPDQLLMQQIQPVMPRIMDTFQTYLRELRPTDLDGSAGLYRLKEELTRRVNTAIAPNKVNAVLFKEIVVQ